MGPALYDFMREDLEKKYMEGQANGVKKGRKEGREEEREFVLKDMVSIGMITQDQADAYRNGRLETQNESPS